MTIAKILIVDDETIMRESLAGWLERDGHAVQTARSGEEALRKCKENHFHILLLDIKMEGMSGLEVLRRVKESDADVAVVMITAYGSIATAIEAMKNGAFDYMLKPFDPNELGVLIEKIIRHQQQARENLYLKEQFKERTRFENMIGQSEPMQKVFDLICDVAPADTTVLISGETGTGKGLAAKAIHSHSRRCHGPYVVVNCGAIPEHLMETELFGHMKGAFTDAKETKKAAWSWPMAAPCFWMKSGRSGCACKSICCGCWKTGSSIGLAAPSRWKPISGWWPPPTAAWSRPSETAVSEKTSTTGSTSWASPCPR